LSLAPKTANRATYGRTGDSEKRGCWPANLRDWFAAHSSVRLGRLDRFPVIRRSRDTLVDVFSRGNSSIRFQTEYGFHIHVPASYRALIIMALRGVLFHSTLVAVAGNTIRPGDIVIDGGSNIGFFALLAATKLLGEGRVYAFEPDPITFSLIQKNVICNGFEGVIQPERLALTDREGTFDFVVNDEEPMLSSLVADNTQTSRHVRVEGVRLDGFLASSGIERADVIKLDLEGAEPLALQGARALLPTTRLLIFEANEPQLLQLGVSPIELVEETALAGKFDSVSFIDERSERVCRWEPREFESALSDYKFINVVCTRSSALEDQAPLTSRSLGHGNQREGIAR
jgi:FkbM family methyltransferase